VCNAIAAALFIRLPRVRWSIATVAVLLAILLANTLVAHRPWQDAALFASVNLAEIALAVLAFRFVWPFPYPNITINHAAIMTAVFGIAIPGLGAIAGGAILHTRLGIAFVEGAREWWSSHAIGACLLGPPIILFSVKELKRLAHGRFLRENIITLVVGLFSCYLAIRWLRFPFVSIGLLLLARGNSPPGARCRRIGEPLPGGIAGHCTPRLLDAPGFRRSRERRTTRRGPGVARQ
jgi:integral membrane sensor domain MASE1